MGNDHKDTLNQTDHCLRKSQHDKDGFRVYNRGGRYVVCLIGHRFEYSLDSSTREASGLDRVAQVKYYFKSHVQTQIFFCINVHTC